MNPNDPNVDIVELVVSKLGGLVEEVVLVGGCATGLLITDSARPPVRPTQDVDLIAEITTYTDYYAFAKKLKKAGFSEDYGLTCRWQFDDIKVDIMPTAENILGFSNKWYSDAIVYAEKITLPSGQKINLISSPLFVATKLEAFYGRGHGDYGLSHDIEDIINVIDGRPELPEEVKGAEEKVKKYLAEEIDDLLARADFTDHLSWHLHSNQESQSRVPYIISQLRSIAGL